MSKTILISAGEISGDKHAANLVKAIKKQDPSINFIGIGGEFLKREGVDIIYDITAASTIGLLEPLRYLPKIMTAYKKITQVMKDQKPDLFIPVDSQGLHMMFLKKAKQFNIPAVYYISPQEWQWGTEEGGKKVISLVEKILAIFPEEEQFYNKCGGNATYVGHPCVESVNSNLVSKEEFYKKQKIDSGKLIFSIFPGSRSQEIKYLLPLFLETIELFCADKTTLVPIISIASSKYRKKIIAILKKYKKTNIKVYEDDSIPLIQHSHIMLSSSGTITLESALQGIPNVVAYKFHPLTYWFAKTFFKQKVDRIKFISLPNLMLNKKVLPEFLQHDATTVNLIDQLNRLLDESNRNKFKYQLDTLTKSLKIENAAEKAAYSVLSVMNA